MAAAVRVQPSADSYLCLLFLFLVVASPVALSQAPSWLDVERTLSVVQGHNASLRCTLQSDEAVSQVTWSFRPSPSVAAVHVATKSQLFGSSVALSYLDRATFTDPQDVSDGSLSVLSVSLSDEGIFTCDFTLFPSGSITGETRLQILVRPVVSLAPGTASLVAGEPPLVAGLCRATNGKPAAVVTWSGLGQGPAPVVTETANSDGTVSVVSELWVSPSRALHGQQVACTVTHPSLTSPETQSLTLSVMFSPEVTVSGFDGQWYLERSDAQLICHAVANPPADSFTWSRDNVSLSALGLDTENASLRFPPLRPDLSGDYSCLAINHVGSGHSSVSVRVTDPPTTAPSGTFPPLPPPNGNSPNHDARGTSAAGGPHDGPGGGGTGAVIGGVLGGLLALCLVTLSVVFGRSAFRRWRKSRFRGDYDARSFRPGEKPSPVPPAARKNPRPCGGDGKTGAAGFPGGSASSVSSSSSRSSHRHDRQQQQQQNQNPVIPGTPPPRYANSETLPLSSGPDFYSDAAADAANAAAANGGDPSGFWAAGTERQIRQRPSHHPPAAGRHRQRRCPGDDEEEEEEPLVVGDDATGDCVPRFGGGAGGAGGGREFLMPVEHDLIPQRDGSMISKKEWYV